MKKSLIALLLILVSAGTFAQNGFTLPSVDPHADSLGVAAIRARLDSIRQHRPTVAVVLAGGGARGLAHLGVIRYMTELGIPIDIIGGTSMGGLVSGFYALGYDYKQMDSLVKSLDWPTIMSDHVPESYQTYKSRKNKERFVVNIPFHYEKEDLRRKFQKEIHNKNIQKRNTGTGDILQEDLEKMGMGMPDGFLLGYNVRNMLSSVSVGYQDSLSFADLPVPMFCVATDMVSMMPYNWLSGELLEALRSTMSIPIYFRPVRGMGLVLVDGAVRNNFPVDIAEGIGADIIIGSEMPGDTDVSEMGSLGSLVMQLIPLMSHITTGVNRKFADVLVQHKIDNYGGLSFDAESVANIIDIGYECAKQYKDQFEKIAQSLGPDAKQVVKGPKAINLNTQKVKVASIRVEGLSEKEYKDLVPRVFLPKDMMFGKKEIESILARIYGTRAFESVTFRMEGKTEPYVLVLDCQKGQTHEAGLVAHIDTDEGVYLGGYIGMNTRKLSGISFRADLKMGNVSALNMNLSYKPSLAFPSINLGLNNKYSSFASWDMNEASAVTYFDSRLDLFIEDSRMVYGKFRLGASAELEPYEHYLSESEIWQGWDFKGHWFSAFADFLLDTADDGYFPTRGFIFGLKGRYAFNGYSVYLRYEGETEPHEGPITPYFVGTAHLSGVIPIGRHFFIQPDVWAGYASQDENNVAMMHTLSAGGTLAGRYVDNQIPFFGFANGLFFCDKFAASAVLNLRYAPSYKDFITLRGGAFMNSKLVKDFFNKPMYAVGLEYGRKSIFGPLKAGVVWCNQTGFNVNLSLGMDF